MLAILFPFSLGLVSVDFSLKVRVRVERVENSRRKADWALVIPVTWKGLPRWHWRWRARPRAQETREGGPGSGRPSTRGGWTRVGKTLHPRDRWIRVRKTLHPRDRWIRVGKTLHPRRVDPGREDPPPERRWTRVGKTPGGGPSHPLQDLPGESTDGGAWGRQSTGSQRVGPD